MGKRNKHQSNRINGISFDYMHNVLGPWIPCPKRKCEGTMMEVWASYGPGDICKEQECTTCGKITKNYADVQRRRQKRRESYKKPWQNHENRA